MLKIFYSYDTHIKALIKMLYHLNCLFAFAADKAVEQFSHRRAYVENFFYFAGAIYDRTAISTNLLRIFAAVYLLNI